MKKIISLILVIISLSSCRDIIDINYLKNPDDRGVLYNIFHWFKLHDDYQILYTLIIMAIMFTIIKLLNIVDWFKNLFTKK